VSDVRFLSGARIGPPQLPAALFIGEQHDLHADRDLGWLKRDLQVQALEQRARSSVCGRSGSRSARTGNGSSALLRSAAVGGASATSSASAALRWRRSSIACSSSATRAAIRRRSADVASSASRFAIWRSMRRWRSAISVESCLSRSAFGALGLLLVFVIGYFAALFPPTQDLLEQPAPESKLIGERSSLDYASTGYSLEACFYSPSLRASWSRR
jgi:hypothetical protein